MTDTQPPKSPTLLPPRKSVELEDPGAHDLGEHENKLPFSNQTATNVAVESSADEDDVFSDAHDGRKPAEIPPSSTRDEEIDDVPNQGQIPGKAAYDMRMQNAVPDGEISKPSSRGSARDSRSGHGRAPIPKTVVEKVDPMEASYGEVPGTTAYALREADAEPDEILKAPPVEGTSSEHLKHISHDAFPVPKTVVTKVDHNPSYGEMKGTEAYRKRERDAAPDVVEEEGDAPSWPTSFENRSSHINRLAPHSPTEGASPIAADGGFGPMHYDDDDDEDEDEEEYDEDDNDEQPIPHRQEREQAQIEAFKDNPIDDEDAEDIGDDFDDFEQGEEATDEDFGDFDDGFQEPAETSAPGPPKQSQPVPITSLPLVDFSKLKTLDDITTAIKPHLDALFPRTAALPPTDPELFPTPPSTSFQTPRSASLYSQLIAPPPLSPPNWTRSRIRRLFLVSLGVPVDLDEILPPTKQKKLVLPYTPAGPSASGAPKSSVTRLKGTGGNASTTSVDSIGSASAPNAAGGKSSKKRKGPAPPPKWDPEAIHALCASTEAELEEMHDDELQARVRELDEASSRGREVLLYWSRRKEEAVKEREAFEGVIENLVRHARRIRK